MKATRLAILFIVACPDTAIPAEACSGGMIPKASAAIQGTKEPPCPPASCVEACVTIPGSSIKTGETVSAYPEGGKLFSYRFNREGIVGAAQEYCYTVKNWSENDERSYSLCVKYKDE